MKARKEYWIALAAVIVIGLWAGFGYWLHSDAERGTFGDMFGAVNALFTGLASLGMVVAILLQGEQIAMQREELKLQREELAETRRELSRAASAQEKSQDALAMQARASVINALEQARLLAETVCNRAHEDFGISTAFTSAKPEAVEASRKRFKAAIERRDAIERLVAGHCDKIVEIAEQQLHSDGSPS